MDELPQVFAAVRRAGGEEAELHPLADITNKEIEEVKQLKHPPREVARVMEVVHLLLTQPMGPMGSMLSSPEWSDVLRTVVRIDFLKRARSINLDGLLQQGKLIDYICRKYFAGPEPLTPDRVRWASKAVVAFFGWTVAIIAGVLPDFPTKVAGEEARRRIQLLDQELRENRRRESEERHAAEHRQEIRKRAEEEQKELAKREVQKAEEAKRLAQQEVEAKEAKEAAIVAATAARQEELRREEAMRREAQNSQSLEAAQLQQQEAERLKKAKKAAAKEAKMMRKKRRMLALDSDESGSEAEKERGTWNSNNPDVRFLSIRGESVTFVSDQFADHCVALTCRPIFYGRHFYEFYIHHFSDQLRCGVTTDSVQAGALVAGHNLRGWCYNTGRMDESRKAVKAGLQINNKVVQDFLFVKDGDAIGVIVDADRWSVAFLRNRVLQGSCAMASPTREPLFLLVHLDAAGDHVELRKISLEEAPSNAVEELDSFTPPSWSILVSDCSSSESEAPGEDSPGPQPHAWSSETKPRAVPHSRPRLSRPGEREQRETHACEASRSCDMEKLEKKFKLNALNTSKSLSSLEKAEKDARPKRSSLLTAGTVLSRPHSAEDKEKSKSSKSKSESPKKAQRERETREMREMREMHETREVTSRSHPSSHSTQREHHDGQAQPGNWNATNETVTTSATSAIPTTSTMPATANTVSLKARLRELKECFDEGLLTLEEFQEEKAIVLQAMRPGAAPQPPTTSATSATSSVVSPTAPVAPLAPLTPLAAPAPVRQEALPESLLGTSFGMPLVQNAEEGWSDCSDAMPEVKGRNFTALLDHCCAVLSAPQRSSCRNFKDGFQSFSIFATAFCVGVSLSGTGSGRCKAKATKMEAPISAPNRWDTNIRRRPLQTNTSVVLRSDMKMDEVLGILLSSNAICVEEGVDGEERVFYVQVTNEATETLEAEGKATSVACISLADLLEAPRHLPLGCLLDQEKEECELYSLTPEPPWLVGLLIFLTVSSAILEYYDGLLQKHLIIAFYLTALVGCGGNAGSQAASLVLQALATGELVPSLKDLGSVLWKELQVSLAIALILAAGVALRILMFGGPLSDAAAIAVAMAITVTFSVIFGASAPLVLQRLGADPAKVSGPLLSTVIDIAGVLVACLSALLFEAMGIW